MNKAFRMMLAATVEDPKKLIYPLIATPKIDGFRCFISPINGDSCGGAGVGLTRSLKTVPNAFVQEGLLSRLPAGLDGELVVVTDEVERRQKDLLGEDVTVATPLYETQSGIMAAWGRPRVRFCVFDYLHTTKDVAWYRGVCTPYEERLSHLHEIVNTLWRKPIQNIYEECGHRVEIVPSQQINSPEELVAYYERCLESGYEGICTRNPIGPYKFGRSSVKEQWLMKWKPYYDSEAVVIGYTERMHNSNPLAKNSAVRRRHTHRRGMVGTNSLGSLLVRDIKTGLEFHVGSGFGEQQRVELWAARDQLVQVGAIIRYKAMALHMKTLPRQPIFLGFRTPEDL